METERKRARILEKGKRRGSFQRGNWGGGEGGNGEGIPLFFPSPDQRCSMLKVRKGGRWEDIKSHQCVIEIACVYYIDLSLHTRKSVGKKRAVRGLRKYHEILNCLLFLPSDLYLGNF